jgi:hypothetical protein
MSKNFGRIIVADFEYEVGDGELPNVLCLVAYELDEHLRHVRTIRLWRVEFGTTPPFRRGPGYTLRRLQCVGGNDVLQGFGLAVSRLHL